MPFSFSRLFLGKKATIIDEDTLPYRPREVVPMAVDAAAIKTKFSLTKIGRALKQKLHLNTLAPVPVGHGPLVLTTNEPFSPFSRRLQLPATPSLLSLPHIPEVSSTLGRDFRNATRFALLVAAGEANVQFANNEIYTTTPCLKRRTRSSSVLGGTGLPRPQTPSDFGGLQLQHHDVEHRGLDSSVPAYLLAPIDLPLIWDGASTYLFEYDEVPDVPPLGFEDYKPPSSPPYIGRAAVETPQPAVRHDWYTQQFVQANTEWCLPRMPASDPAPSSNESLPTFPDLKFRPRESLPASSAYSSFSPAHNADTRISNEEFFSPQKSELTTYSPVKLGEYAEFFPHTFDQSPPADDSAREAQSYNPVEPLSIETAELRSISRSESESAAANEKFCKTAESDVHVTAHEAPATQIELLFEPRSTQTVLESIAQALANTHEDILGHLAAPSEEQSDGTLNNGAATRTISTGTVVFHAPREDTRRFLQDSLVLRQLTRHAPDAVLLPGPERRVQIIARGPARVVAGFDLFASEEQYRLIESANVPNSCSSSTLDSTGEASGTRLEQIDWTDPSSPVSDTFDDPSILEAYNVAVADLPTIADVLSSPMFLSASPQKKQVTFARARRIITLAGTIREEFEDVRDRTEPSQDRQVSTFVELVSEMQDLKDDWHQDDQDFLLIGEHVAGYEVPQEDIDRDSATKDALTCLQTRLASVQTKLVDMESLERALESRHQSHMDTAERAAELANEVLILQARESAGKVVFDQMISDKLAELVSKERELETLRMLCNSEPVITELAELHEALRESRKSKLEYLQLAEDSFALLQRADERQAQAEHDMHTAKIAQTFAEIEKQGAEEYHETLKERIVELESDRDQAFEGRNLALAEMSKWQREGAARDLSSTPPGHPSPTTLFGSPNDYHARQEYAEIETAEEEAWSLETEGNEKVGEITQSPTEKLKDWTDSEIF